ncbi:MAG: RNA 2',3'-cyclic phosphodiesterase [Egibacteraceae bacterium]
MTDDAKARQFAAVEVPEEVRDAIEAATEPLRRSAVQVRWVAPDAYHLTLAFVGWVDDAGARALEDACAAAASTVQPFSMGLTGAAGTFGGGVLWAGLADCPPLERLASALRAGLGERGMRVEQRPFHAHVTLARAARDARIPRRLVDAYAGPRATWPVERLVTMRSRLRRSGARYRVEGAWPLGPV